MGRVWLAAVLGGIGLWAPGATAAICDVTYKVQAGDTIVSVAERHYGDAEPWTLIYQANQAVLNGQDMVPGTDLHIPCAKDAVTSDASVPTADAVAPEPGSAPGAEAAPEPGSAPELRGELVMLTGGNYMPFADKAWPEQGLAVELVTAALAASPYPVDVEMVWEDDRSLHLFPMIDEKQRDMGFPWVRPDCAATPDIMACRRFHYSDPLMELPVMLFKRADRDLTYDRDADMAGLRLCRPAGFFTHDLDRAGRRWLSEELIELVQPETPEACFEALMAGDVDAVTVDVFLGAAKIVSMGLRGRVVPIETPLSRETLHAVISKSHARGTTHVYRVNAGLAALRADGRYAEIVGRHLEIFWNRLKE